MAEVTTSADRSKLSLSKKNKLTIGKTKVKTPTKLTGATEGGNIIRGSNPSGRRNRQKVSTATVTEGGQGGQRTQKVTQSKPNPNATGSVTSQGPGKVPTTIEARDTALGRNTRYVDGRPDTTNPRSSGGKPRSGALFDPRTKKTAINNIKKALDILQGVAGFATSPKGSVYGLTAHAIFQDLFNRPVGPMDAEGNPIDERLLMEASQSSDPAAYTDEVFSGQMDERVKDHILESR